MVGSKIKDVPELLINKPNRPTKFKYLIDLTISILRITACLSGVLFLRISLS